jgi:hypothetical protein
MANPATIQENDPAKSDPVATAAKGMISRLTLVKRYKSLSPMFHFIEQLRF